MMGFLRSNLKVLSLMTAVLALTMISLILLLFRDSGKELLLAVRPVPSELLVRLDMLPLITEDEAGSRAVGYLQRADVEPLSARSLYDPVEDELDVSVQSADERALDDAARAIIGTIEGEFEESYEEQMSVKLRTRLFQLERGIEANLDTIDRIDRQTE